MRRIFAEAVARLRKMQEERVLVEGYIPGREYAVEGIATHGEFRALAIFDKPDPLEGPYFEETIYTTPSRAPEAVQRAGRDGGGGGAAARIEARPGARRAAAQRGRGVDSGGARAADRRVVRRRRCGSWVGCRSRSSTGAARARRGRVEAWIAEAGGVGVMMIPIPHGGLYQSVEGEERARAVPGIEEVIVTAKEGQLLIPAARRRELHGFIFARAEISR